MKENKIHIIGAGAVGFLFAKSLIKSGKLVSFVNRPLISRFSDSKTIFKTVPESTDISTLLITTKAYDVISAFKSISHKLSPESRVIILANGLLGVHDEIRSITDRPIILASTSLGAIKTSPTSFLQTGYSGKSLFGTFDSNIQVPLFLKGLDDLNPEIFDYDQRDSFRNQLLLKIVVNSCINPTTAIKNKNFRFTNGMLLNKDDLELIKQVCLECFNVFSSYGWIGSELSYKILEDAVIDTIKATSDNISSMSQDVINGKMTEIDFINGWIVKKGRKANVCTPICEHLWSQIRQIQQ